MVLDQYYRPPFASGINLHLGAIASNAAELVKEFDVRTSSAQAPVGTLSRRTEQKVILARELGRDHKVLVSASQPTRGLDVGSIEFVHKRIVQQRDHGVAVLIVSADVRYQADVESFLLKKRTLLNVKFDELMKAAAGNSDGVQWSVESSLRAPIFKAAALFVTQSERLPGSEHAGHHSASQTANAEARRFFSGEDDQLDGTPRREAKLLQNANRFKAAEHADAAVVEARVGDRVNVRAGADGRERWIGTFPARKGIAHGVFANFEPCGLAKAFHISACAQIGLAEDHARHYRRIRFRDLPQSQELSDQAVDRKFGARGCHSSSPKGCRRQSL